MSTIAVTNTASTDPPVYPNVIWSKSEKILFRIAFIFFLLLIIPLDTSWYIQLFHSKSFFWVLSAFTGYRANFIQLHSESARFGIAGYSSWGIALIMSIISGTIWTFIVRKKIIDNYKNLYYWLQVLVRYRIAIGIIAFGFLKLYPMQMPYPAISNLETNLGDYNTYKIYWQQVGVSIWYEIVLGLVEILGGILLFFRPTIALGAVINAGVLYNIAHANIAYDGSVHVYSSLFVLLSLFILIPYIKYLWQLLILRINVTPHYYRPVFSTKKAIYWIKFIKYSFIFLFTIIYGLLRYDVHYHQGYLKDPINPGLTNAAGFYNVTTFKLNGQEIPYNPLDTTRWQNVIFEKWSTLTYQVHKAFPISLGNGTPDKDDVNRNYELAGIAGGRRFLYYKADTTKGILYLQDKNSKPNWEDRDTERRNKSGKGKGKKGNPAKDNDIKQVWHFLRPTQNQIILYGINEQKDSIYAVLDRVKKNYPIQIKRSDVN